MHDLDVFLDLIRKKQLVGFSLSRTENDSLSNTTINDQDVCECADAVLPGAVNGEMIHSTRCLVLQVLREINGLKLRRKELASHIFYPEGDGSREKKSLDVLWRLFFDIVHNLFYILLEAKLEHLVSLVQDDSSHVREVEVLSLNMVENSTSGANEDVNTPSELISLLVNRNTTVHSEDIVLLLIVLKCVELLRDLKSKLTSRRKYHALDLATAKCLALAEEFDGGKGEAKGLAGASQVSDDQILALPNVTERTNLHWEEIVNSSRLKALTSLLGDLGEIFKISFVFHEISL